LNKRRLIATMYVSSAISVILMAYAVQKLWLGTEPQISFIGSHQALLVSDLFLAISVVLFILVLLIFRNRAMNFAISVPSIVLGVAPFFLERWAFTDWIFNGFN
jgi:hypothetical protein